jgi:hypothetical protein
MDQYKAHFIDGGAYRRAYWGEGLYWHFNARPTSFNSGMVGLDESTPTAKGLWIGSQWNGEFWEPMNILPKEASMDDWQWISQIAINNITKDFNGS